MTKPNLSVLIDTYNHERYIEQAVVSAIEQGLAAAEYEIVVVDDGSTDQTAEIVRKFAPRVRLLSKRNGGQASAFNAGISETRGRLIAFLDGDDWWTKSKLTVVLEAFEREPQRAAVSHAYYETYADRNEEIFHGPKEEEILHLSTPEAANLAREHWQFLLPCALTVRREVLEEILPIPEILVFSADGPIAAVAMAKGTRVLPQPLAHYRVHASNLNAIDERDLTKTRRKYEIGSAMFDIVEKTLIRQGVRPECVAALLDKPRVHASRTILSSFGGSRLKALETEMRAFRCEEKDSTFAYRLFKYVGVGGATLLLSPRHFYKIRDWYARRGLKRIREEFTRSR